MSLYLYHDVAKMEVILTISYVEEWIKVSVEDNVGSCMYIINGDIADDL